MQKNARVQGNIAITKTIHGRLPSLPFARLKSAVLGEKYWLSVVIAGDHLTRRLNREYRGKDKPANVLSFPLTDEEGELFLNPRAALRDAPAFHMREHDFLLLLFIHGLLHLKGYEHGRTMEEAEQKFCQHFGK
jgi:rRNA maturation RNase YbeY